MDVPFFQIKNPVKKTWYSRLLNDLHIVRRHAHKGNGYSVGTCSWHRNLFSRRGIFESVRYQCSGYILSAHSKYNHQMYRYSRIIRSCMTKTPAKIANHFAKKYKGYNQIALSIRRKSVSRLSKWQKSEKFGELDVNTLKYWNTTA